MFPSLSKLVLTVLVVVFTVNAGQLESRNNLKSRLDEYLKKVTAEQNFSGAVLVAQDGRIVLDKGYGWADLKKTRPVVRDTKFYIASITKQFTAAAILRLEEQKRLSVNDSITKYFKDVPPEKTPITIHQLLTHTSGLGQNYAADGIQNRDDAVRAILKPPLKSTPGEKFGYSNDGYTLLAAIVEIASDKSYEAFLRMEILRPAGMTESGFWDDSFSPHERPMAETLRQVDLKPNWGFRGATGMWSTTEDLYRYQQALFTALFTNRLLKEEAMKKMFSPYATTSRGKYAYGWFISRGPEGREEIWTAGAEDFGHNSIIKTFADGTVIIVVSNAGNISGAPARSVVGDGLARIVFNVEHKVSPS